MLDTNLYFSYLLPPADPNRAVHRLIAHLSSGTYRLIFPYELFEEILLVIRTKPYFRGRVGEQDARSVLVRLQRRSEVPARLSSVPRVVRDPKDDYLLAYAVLERADFLVTGDRDLLALDGEIERLRIVTAVAFLQLLDERSSGL
jgi:putative PIN family toxin of toxin-antitoxin system